jgi:hypothetical protein
MGRISRHDKELGVAIRDGRDVVTPRNVVVKGWFIK